MIGDPVEHSLSPAIHNAAFHALGIDWVYVAFPVPAGEGAAAVDAMRVLGISGLSVTMPHKATVAERVDSLGPISSRLGVVNTVSWDESSGEDVIRGDSTDGPGFLDSLRGDEGFDPAGRRCLVLGTGGAARAVTLALGDAGADYILVAGRHEDSARSCASLVEGARVLADTTAESLRTEISSADLVVNTTPVGMRPGDGLPFGIRPGWIRRDQYITDLIYAPASTPLLTAARQRGATCSNGLGMLVHQAARQVEIWTGRPAPLEAMSAAAITTLGHHAHQPVL